MNDTLSALRREIHAAQQMHSVGRGCTYNSNSSTTRHSGTQKQQRCASGGGCGRSSLVDVKRVRENVSEVHLIREPPRFSVSSGNIALSQDEQFLAVVTCTPKCKLVVVDAASLMVVAQVRLHDCDHHDDKKHMLQSANTTSPSSADHAEGGAPLLVEKVQWVGRAIILLAYTNGRTLVVMTGLRDEDGQSSESDDDDVVASSVGGTTILQRPLAIGHHLVDVDAVSLNPTVAAVLAVEHTATSVVFVSIVKTPSRKLHVVERICILGMVHVTHGCLVPSKNDGPVAVLCCSGSVSVYQVHRMTSGRDGGATLLKTFIYGSSMLIQGILSDPASPTDVHCFFFERAHPQPPLLPTSGILLVDGEDPKPFVGCTEDANETPGRIDAHLFHSIGPLNSVTGGATATVPLASLTITSRSVVGSAKNGPLSASSGGGESDLYLGCVTLSTLHETPGIDRNATATVRRSKWVGLPLSLRLVPLTHSVVLWTPEKLVTVKLEDCELIVSHQCIMCHDVGKAQLQAAAQDTSPHNSETLQWAGVAFLRGPDPILSCFAVMGAVVTAQGEDNTLAAVGCRATLSSGLSKNLAPLVVLQKVSLLSWTWDGSIVDDLSGPSECDGHVTAEDVRRIVREENNNMFKRIEMLLKSVEHRLTARMESNNASV